MHACMHECTRASRFVCLHYECIHACVQMLKTNGIQINIQIAGQECCNTWIQVDKNTATHEYSWIAIAKMCSHLLRFVGEETASWDHDPSGRNKWCSTYTPPRTCNKQCPTCVMSHRCHVPQVSCPTQTEPVRARSIHTHTDTKIHIRTDTHSL